ncbi:hypothetical protein [Periweissella ghanensis]|uniref:PepSY domain-containing protein n=1 Tax=Periweissella ghanensis TaxID=467997 RepID=A0ABM8ZAU6_9LACO|nr:hypothetical protein [Periweissella ghanensis]MCM0600751.1 hypothetical protein [Periweissella ghanensis]CAH0418607.1 hypothetical protein WGH24286_01028 [Periweissella ghanensis]
MNKKGFGIIAGIIGSIGVAAAIGSKGAQEKSVAKTHAKLISKIHDEFTSYGKIEGTWITRETETYFANSTSYTVYNGGVTLRKNSELEQYRLKIDAKTLAIVLQEKIL